jgi:SSS family solute:Na+ symporter
MAENMFRALWSCMACILVTVVVSMLTTPRPEKELVGLVYGATQIPTERDMVFYKRPIFWAAVVTVIFIALNVVFW